LWATQLTLRRDLMTDDWKERAASILLPGEVIQEPEKPKPKKIKRSKKKQSSKRVPTKGVFSYEYNESDDGLLIKGLQRALDVPADGIIGPRTLTAWKNAYDADGVFMVKNNTNAAVILPGVEITLDPFEERIIVVPSSVWQNDNLLAMVRRAYISIAPVPVPEKWWL